jgi:hypothetical protein
VDSSDVAQTPTQRERVAQVYSEFSMLRKKLAAEGPALEREAHAHPELQQAVNPDRAERCAPGQVDPSFVPAETRKEQAQVVELVRHHPEVSRAAGTVQRASIAESSTTGDSNMPSHYSVYVRAERPIYAEVDVTRSGGRADFVLRCVTSVAPGQSEARSDPCAQQSK